MAEPLVVIGAGGFGREALDVIDALNADSYVFDLLGVVDSGPSELNLQRLADRGIAYLGTEDEFLTQSEPVSFVVAIGSPAVRRIVVRRMSMAGHGSATLVHPRALLGSRVSVGEGSVVCGGVHVSTNVTLGRHVHLNPNATIGHDSVLADFVSVNPAAVVSGEVQVGDGVLVGAGATILQGLTVGAHAVVGAAACVVRDVEAGRTVKGVPAR